MREVLRRAAYGLSTLIGRPRGFFIPYRYAAEVRRPTTYPALEPVFAAAETACRAVIGAIEDVASDLAAIAAGPGPARFDQDWFARLDAAAAYAIVRRERPGRIVEIGSGHSTRFLARAVSDGALPTDLVAIDPNPRAALQGLAVRHVRRLLAEPDLDLVSGLVAGDILFVDSSHVAMPGTDVDRLACDLLHRIAPGVLVHVHDITLPDAYPQDWTWRGYNEAAVIAALLAGEGFEIVFSSHWVATRRPDWLQTGILNSLPLPRGARETSLWLRKRASGPAAESSPAPSRPA